MRRASNVKREIEAQYQKQNRKISQDNERLIRELDERSNEYNHALSLAEDRLSRMKSEENAIHDETEMKGMEHERQTEALNRMTRDRDEMLSKLQEYSTSLKEEKRKLSEMFRART